MKFYLEKMQGFLNINKPIGQTSHAVVAQIRRLVAKQVKVGHAGTLDPAASGVLPIALGSATRLIEYLAAAHKGYRAVVQLGQTTTTDDAEGEPLAQRPVPPLDAATLETVLAPLHGDILQIPPMYAALHHQGKRLYELARAGQVVERAPRPVTITRLEVVARGDTQLTLLVECSKGTYIRALARDLGTALGCGAHLSALERTFVGDFSLAQATALAELQAHPELLPQILLPPETVILQWPLVVLDAQQIRAVCNGQLLKLVENLEGEWARAHSPDGQLLALLHRQEKLWQPEKVLR